MIRTKKILMEVANKSNLLYTPSQEELEDLQECLRTMYCDIEKVCVAHNLTILAGGGTLLGAIRHKGFIPWDDDLDVLMPRNDYNLFVTKYYKELPSRYILYAPNHPNGPLARFAKVVNKETTYIGSKNAITPLFNSGIFIDIFPVENSRVKKIHQKLFQFISYVFMYIASSVDMYVTNNEVYRKLMLSNNKAMINYYLRQLLGWMFSFHSPSWWNNELDVLFQYKKNTGFYCRPSIGIKGGFVPVKGSDLFPVHKAEFDDIEVFVPNNPEVLLKLDYGNWKEIPPETERGKHYFKFSK